MLLYDQSGAYTRRAAIPTAPAAALASFLCQAARPGHAGFAASSGGLWRNDHIGSSGRRWRIADLMYDFTENAFPVTADAGTAELRRNVATSGRQTISPTVLASFSPRQAIRLALTPVTWERLPDPPRRDAELLLPREGECDQRPQGAGLVPPTRDRDLRPHGPGRRRRLERNPLSPSARLPVAAKVVWTRRDRHRPRQAAVRKRLHARARTVPAGSDRLGRPSRMPPSIVQDPNYTTVWSGTPPQRKAQATAARRRPLRDLPERLEPAI